jgi:molybdopterin converting factor small subunit
MTPAVTICNRQHNPTGKGVAMPEPTTTTVRMFGALHTHRKERGLQSTTEIIIPQGGCTACDLAVKLGLPLEKIEAVFVNHRAHSLDHLIQTGDRVAFVPTGIPAPDRILLGIYIAGRNENGT